MSPEARAAEMEVVLTLAPLLDKYGRGPVGEVLAKISRTLLDKPREKADGAA